jgi:hypothetical protein
MDLNYVSFQEAMEAVILYEVEAPIFSRRSAQGLPHAQAAFYPQKNLLGLISVRCRVDP